MSVDRTYALELVRYRDAGLPTYTWFYIIEGKVVSPYFESDVEAEKWLFSLVKNYK